jgi:hypothetical protein
MRTQIILALSLFLNSCVALGQDDLEFIDFTAATERPEFNLVDMKDGSSYESLNHVGAAYLIEFYFAGCPACNENAENMNQMAFHFAGSRNVQVVEISIDCDGRDYRTWISRHAPVSPVLNGCDSEIVERLGVSRFPTTFVYAPDRREAMRGIGVWSQSTYDRIKRYLDQVDR